MTVGERLRKARQKLKKTQAEIAAELGKTQPTVASWEAGDSLPHAKEVRAAARVYGLKPEQLLPVEGEAA